MGLGHSLTNIQKSLTNSITQNVTKTIQSVSQSSKYLQALQVECTETALRINEAFLACVEDKDEDFIRLVCDPILKLANACTVHNVSLEQLVNVELSTEQFNAVQA